MARLSDDDFTALRKERDDDASRALGDVRRASGAQRNSEIEAWLAAGDNLAEKAIAALDTGDDAGARRLVGRIVALPVVDTDTHAGLMAVHLLLYNEVVDPSFEGGEGHGLLERPLRLLPTLDRAAADALRHVLAAMTDYDLPAGMLNRIRSVVPLERRLEPPFADVPVPALSDAIVSVLRLILLLRSDEG
jgi:hypothetical protein